MKDPIFQRLLQLHPKFSDLSLGRINQLLKKIGFNEKKIPKVIHIAGTNGKGSTAAILKSILNHHGYSTHVYTTPHLVDFNERIQLNSKNISNKKLLEYLRYCEKKNDGKLITFFEITTAAAFKAFQDHQADFLILEVGLGGRFDATNILKLPKFAAVTPISLDHQDFLGNSLNKIAFEKLGILNQKSINFINKQKPSVMNFIHSELKRRDLRAKFFGEHWKIKSNAYLSNNIKIDLSYLNLQGKHQKINAGLAIHVAQHILQKKFDLPQTQKALTECHWPGRMQSVTKGFLFQKLKNFKDITLDGFHNIDGMNTLIQNLPTNRKILICSFLNNKKFTQILTKLSEHFQKIIVVQMNEENSITKKDLPANLKLIFCSSLKNSVKIINQYSNSQTSIYFGGSLYFIGEFLKLNQSK
ncbi:Mur ligase family protein [Alphaproteobacteria bacterium]|nr:Mur ligase family protein [Alphaproteobacteria bacterium]